MGTIYPPLAALALIALARSLAQAGEFEDKAKEQYKTASLFSPPEGWSAPRFKLSQRYPEEPPPEPNPPWMGADFRVAGQETEYMRRVLEYCLDGNVAADFRVKDNEMPKWYHAPWMHFGPGGREPIRGLTRERPAPPKSLHDSQTRWVQNWAVGFYNARGGYILGQFWKDPARPNSSMPRFPVGTAVFKLLFTNATAAEVPHLAGSVEWQAMINQTSPAPEFKILATREPSPVPVRLLQIDIAVRDERANATTGWVFGTFVYNAALAAPGDTPWKRLMPVGLMWGNDPTFTPAPGTKPGESWLNPAAVALLTTSQRKELGFQGRVNGPVDNPRSSCLSCHMTAQDRVAPPMFDSRSRGGSDYSDLPESAWFRNLKPPDPFKAEEKSLDYSLQLAGGLENFRDWKRQTFPAVAAAPGVAPGDKPTAVKMVTRGEEEPPANVNPPAEPTPQKPAPPQPDRPAGDVPGWVWFLVALAVVGAVALLFRRRRG